MALKPPVPSPSCALCVYWKLRISPNSPLHLRIAHQPPLRPPDCVLRHLLLLDPHFVLAMRYDMEVGNSQIRLRSFLNAPLFVCMCVYVCIFTDVYIHVLLSHCPPHPSLLFSLFIAFLRLLITPIPSFSVYPMFLKFLVYVYLLCGPQSALYCVWEYKYWIM